MGLFILLFTTAAFIGYMAIHFVLARAMSEPVKWGTLRRIFFAMLPFAGVTAWSLAGHIELTETSTPLRALCSLILLLLLFVGYLMFYSINDRSLSVRAMVDFYRRGNDPISFQELTVRYDTGRSFRRRIEILVEAGYLTRSGNSLALTSGGRRLATIIRTLKLVYRTGKGG